MFTTESPNSVVERISVLFGTGFIAISTGMVTNFSTSSALRPGHCVMTVTFVLETSGKASTGVCMKLTAPATTAITVRKKIKKRFLSEKEIMLSINLCIPIYFSWLYTRRAFRPITVSPAFTPPLR